MAEPVASVVSRVVVVPLDSLVESTQLVRFEYDAADVAELADSIRAVGVVEPLVVRPRGDRFEIIAGMRRYHAAKIARLDAVPCVVRECSDDEAVILALTENVNRRDMNVVEEGVTFGKWLEATGKDVADLAKVLGRDPSYVYKRLSILEMDPDSLNGMVRGDLSLHHALELKRVADPSTRAYLLDLTVKNGASVSVVRGWVDQYLREGEAMPAPDLGQQVQSGAPGPPVPKMGCFFCGRDAGEVMLRARFVCSECDAGLRVELQRQGRTDV